jgi:hypothetical protein
VSTPGAPDSFAVRKHVEIIVVPGWALSRQGEMNPVGRVRIGNIAGLGLEKDAAERISSTRGKKYEAGKKEPRVGGAGLRASKGS